MTAPRISRTKAWNRLRNAFLGAGVISLLALEPLAGCAAGPNASIMRRDALISLISGREREKDAEAAIDAMQRYGDRESAELAGRIPEYHARARALVRALGLRDDASALINFSYAIAVLGEAGARDLHRGLGIEYFMRYSRGTLLEIRETLRSSGEEPLLVAVLNKNDHNGAFYREGQALGALLPGYRVLVFETDGEGGFYSRIPEIARTHGRISALVIGGHGESGSIQLGENNEPGRLDLGDAEEIAALRASFVDRPVVVLASCSTGASDKAIGAVISRALSARLFAPVEPSSRTEYHLDRHGRITRVTYNVDARSFLAGVAE